ncbi:hypothetical protein Hanom_Chr01g00002421 [Helianthus anomalus]
MMPETLREDKTTNTSQSIMKYAQVIQAQTRGPPSSPPNTTLLSTKTEIHPTEVEKKTNNEKLNPDAFSIYNGSPYAIKLYAVSISHGTPIPTYMFTELLHKVKKKVCSMFQFLVSFVPPKVCFSASGSKRFEILPFSSDSLTAFIFLRKVKGIFVFFANLKGNLVFFTLRKKTGYPEKGRKYLRHNGENGWS